MAHVSIRGLLCTILVGCAGSPPPLPTNSVAIGSYSHTLHDRFYQAWQQPASVGLPPWTISVPVDVSIDSTGKVLDFRIVKSSGNARLDRSIAAVGKKVRQVATPPIKSDQPYKLKIYFELDVVR